MCRKHVLTLGALLAVVAVLGGCAGVTRTRQARPPRAVEIRLPSIFGDHMVLQQGRTVPVWGWAEPGRSVVVEFRGQRREAIAGDDGR